MKVIIFGFALLCVCGLRGSVFDRLQTIPVEDRSVLEWFFQFLLCDNECAYTLFGEKPITMAITFPSPTLEHAAERLIFERGWEAWTRYQHLFPSSRFILKRDVLGEQLAVTISLINKPLVYEKIAQNLSIFQNTLGSLSLDEIFDQICYKEKSIFDLTSPHPQALVGILLGYGTRNALNFQHEIEIFEGLSRQLPPLALSKTVDTFSLVEKGLLKGCGQKRYRLQTIAPSLSCIMNDINEIHRKRQIVDIGNQTLDRCSPPAFAGWENEETEKLKQSYAQARSIIREKYKNGSVLEITLNQWMSPDENDHMVIANTSLQLHQN